MPPSAVAVGRTVQAYAMYVTLSHSRLRNCRGCRGMQRAKHAIRTAQQALGHKHMATTAQQARLAKLTPGYPTN